MFKGNIYFPVRLGAASDLYTDFEGAVANGLFSNPQYVGDERLFAFHEEADAVAVGKSLFQNSGVIIPGARNEVPVFAVVHIGPIAPAGLPANCAEAIRIHDRDAIAIAPNGVQRIAQIVRAGSFAWNRVDMTIKLITV